jgi:hypothetical protein
MHWIVKLPSAKFPNVPENEFAMMELARRVGIAVPETGLIPLRHISGLPSVDRKCRHAPEELVFDLPGSTPRIARTAYDFVSTIAYLPDDRLALTFVDSKQFSSVTTDQFERFAAKARLPTKLTLDTVHETVTRFAAAWSNPDAFFDNRIRAAIERHLQSVPLG